MGFAFQIGKAKQAFSGSRVSVGTHVSCDLVIDDPVAARHHVDLVLSRKGLLVEPRETATGTYLGGVELDGPATWHAGAELILGATKLELGVFDPGAGTCEITVHERTFFHVAKKRGEFHSDADERVRSEVRFGRFRSLRWVNALVALAIVAGLVGALVMGPGPAAVWASPGPIAGGHGAGFAAAHQDQLAGWTLAQLTEARLGCDACHKGEAGDFASSITCSGCHADLFQALEPGGRHPFMGPDESDCRSCHRIHGPDHDLAIRTRLSRNCVSCHEHNGDTNAALEERIVGSPMGVAPLPSSGFEGFRHSDHVASATSAAGAKLECATCHGSPDGGAHYDVPTGAGLCFECHGSEAPDGAARRVALDLGEHGSSGELCQSCHVTPGVAELLPASLGDVTLLFQVPSAHVQSDSKCSECHLKALPTSGGRSASPFGHALHMDLSQDASALTRECQQCHFKSGLPAALRPDDYGSTDMTAFMNAECAECHGQQVVIDPPPAERRAPEGLAKFSHDAHASKHACAECHVADGGTDVVRTAKSCSDCHYDKTTGQHRHPAKLSACSYCHVGSNGMDRSAPVESGDARSGFAELFGVKAEDPLDGTRSAGFLHGMAGHLDLDCAACHRWEEVDGPASALTQTSPSSSCQACHRQSRMHWR